MDLSPCDRVFHPLVCRFRLSVEEIVYVMSFFHLLVNVRTIITQSNSLLGIDINRTSGSMSVPHTPRQPAEDRYASSDTLAQPRRTVSLSQSQVRAALWRSGGLQRNAHSLSFEPFLDDSTLYPVENCEFCALELQGFVFEPSIPYALSGSGYIPVGSRMWTRNSVGSREMDSGAFLDTDSSSLSVKVSPAKQVRHHADNSLKPRHAHKKTKSARGKHHQASNEMTSAKRSLDSSRGGAEGTAGFNIPRRLMRSLTNIPSDDDFKENKLIAKTKKVSDHRVSFDLSLHCCQEPVAPDVPKLPHVAKMKADVVDEPSLPKCPPYNREEFQRTKLSAFADPMSPLAEIVEEGAALTPEETDAHGLNFKEISTSTQDDASISKTAGDTDSSSVDDAETSICDKSASEDDFPKKRRSWRKRLRALQTTVKRRISLAPGGFLPLNKPEKKEERETVSAAVVQKIPKLRARSHSEPNIRQGNFAIEWFCPDDDCSLNSCSESVSGISGGESDCSVNSDVRGIPDALSSAMYAHEGEKLYLFDEYIKKSRKNPTYKFYLCDDDNEDSSDNEILDVPLARRSRVGEKSCSESSTATVLPAFSSRSFDLHFDLPSVTRERKQHGPTLSVDCPTSYITDNVTSSAATDTAISSAQNDSEEEPSVLCVTPGSLPDITLIPCSPRTPAGNKIPQYLVADLHDDGDNDDVTGASFYDPLHDAGRPQRCVPCVHFVSYPQLQFFDVNKLYFWG